MSDTPVRGFESFLERHSPDLARIARASRGEWQVDDVRNQAWLLAFDLGRKHDQPLDLDNPDDALLLIRHLYNHCVKYGETVVRYARQLDHSDDRDDDRGQHWLKDRLIADEGEHPLSLLEAMESATPEPDDPDAYHSAAAAWIRLLQRFDQRMGHIAEFLLISVSWCYACRRQAHHQAVTQWPLPHGLLIGIDETALRPWRRFKLPATRPTNDPRQLRFDYWTQPPQPPGGQLWLL